MTKSPQRARDASKPAVRKRKNVTPASESPRADSGSFVKVDITPEDFFKAWSRKEREALVELLIESFDAEAGDPDLEPSLGFRAGEQFVGRGCEQAEIGDDREVEDEHEEEGWDREDVCEDEGSEHDGSEPSLGWTPDEAAHGRAYAGAFGRCFDLEEDAGSMREIDPGEAGIADMDGLMEQCAGHRAVSGHWAGRTRYEPYVS
jgi:hypothetical protein